MGNREVQRGVQRLTDKYPGVEIAAGYDVQAVWALPMSHADTIADRT
jgi:hypothetical protein